MNILLIIGVVFSLGPQEAVEDSNEPGNPGGKAFTVIAIAEAKSYKFSWTSARDSKIELRPTPVLRYTNPVSGSDNGHVFVWTASGRPEAICAVYKYPTRPLSTEFHSLSTGNMKAVRDDGKTWQPAVVGVTFRTVPDSPLPARNAAQRLVQMRSLARGFQAQLTERNQQQYKLRLLAQPLVRYSSKVENVQDGGLFAFVQGTNPDVLLLLESRPAGAGNRWQYAIARMHHRKISVRYKDTEVWSVDQLTNDQKGDLSSPYTILRRSSQAQGR